MSPRTSAKRRLEPVIDLDEVRPPAPEPEPVVDVSQWAAGLRQAFLLCRELGHNWRPLTAVWEPPREVFVRVLRCQRCRSDREQTLTAWGHILTNHYVYPDGYRITGVGRLIGEDRDILRLESIHRSIKPGSE